MKISQRIVLDKKSYNWLKITQILYSDNIVFCYLIKSFLKNLKFEFVETAEIFVRKPLPRPHFI